jgi:hypothetical protein
MERRDRWGVAFVGCFILGLVVLSVTAAAVRFPNGEYDMQAMWTIAAAGFAAWVVFTAILATAWFRVRRREGRAPKGR